MAKSLATRRPDGRSGPGGPFLDSRKSSLYNRPRSPCVPPSGRQGAQVAQLVEHCTENAGVGGSIPPLGTTYIFYHWFYLCFLDFVPPTIGVGHGSIICMAFSASLI